MKIGEELDADSTTVNSNDEGLLSFLVDLERNSRDEVPMSPKVMLGIQQSLTSRLVNNQVFEKWICVSYASPKHPEINPKASPKHC